MDLRSQSGERDRVPDWAVSSLAECPFVVVRRALKDASGAIPVGVRGRIRSQRFGTYILPEHVHRVVSPMDLVTAYRQARQSRCLPVSGPLAAFSEMCDLAQWYSLNWGPGGSAGFDLAMEVFLETVSAVSSGETEAEPSRRRRSQDHFNDPPIEIRQSFLTYTSDLDIIVYADHPLSREQLVRLYEALPRTDTAIDVQIETPSCGFSLIEFLRAGGAEVLFKTPNGPILGPDPWSCAMAEPVAI